MGVSKRYEAVFVLDKETKGTYRFSEVAQGRPPAVRNIYIQKWFFEKEPRKIKVTIEVIE